MIRKMPLLLLAVFSFAFGELKELWSDTSLPSFSFTSEYSEEKGSILKDQGVYCTPIDNTIFLSASFHGETDEYTYTVTREVRYNYADSTYEVFGRIGPDPGALISKLQTEANSANAGKTKKNFFGTVILDNYKVLGGNIFWHPHDPDIVAFQNKEDNNVYLYRYSSKSILGTLPCYGIYSFSWSPAGDCFSIRMLKYKGADPVNYVVGTGLGKNRQFMEKIDSALSRVSNIIAPERSMTPRDGNGIDE